MYFLGKAFELRGQAHGEEDKPFLDHLEDLRIMITRIVITLLITTLGCWVFHKQVLDVIRRPVHQTWNARQLPTLPPDISPDHWEHLKKIRHTANLLPPPQRQSFIETVGGESLYTQVEATNYYIVSLKIPDEKKRQQWLNSLNLPQDQNELLQQLAEKKPNPKLNAKGDIVDMKALKPTEPFMLAFKVSIFAGVIISFPLNLFFALQFILPGMKENEKKILFPSMLFGFGLFLLGVAFCYFIVMPRALDFFLSFGAGMSVDNQWRIGEYISFATMFTLMFGLAFELPVIVMALVKLGLLGFQTMSNTRSYAIVAIVIIAAVITPTGDLLTLSMMAVPMYLLYEGCIWLSYLDYKKALKAEEAEQEEQRRKGARSTPEITSAAGVIAMNAENSDADSETSLTSQKDQTDQKNNGEEDEYDDFYDEHEYKEHLAQERAANAFADDPISEEDEFYANYTDDEAGECDSDSYEENLAQQQAIDFNPGMSYSSSSEEDLGSEKDEKKEGNSEKDQNNKPKP